MPTPFLYIKTVLFKIIQVSKDTQFKYQRQFYFKLFSFLNKVKGFHVLQCITNNLIKHWLFIYTQLNVKIHPDYHSWWISKMQSDNLEERYAIKFCFKPGKNATETYGMLPTAFRPSCMNRASVFEWHKRVKGGRESVSDDERCGRSKKVNRAELIVKGLGYYFEVLREFSKIFRQKRSALFKSGQWHFHLDNAPVHNSTLVTDYLTKMGIKTVCSPSQ